MISYVRGGSLNTITLTQARLLVDAAASAIASVAPGGSDLAPNAMWHAHIAYGTEIVLSREFGARSRSGYSQCRNFSRVSDPICYELFGYSVRRDESDRLDGIMNIRSASSDVHYSLLRS